MTNREWLNSLTDEEYLQILAYTYGEINDVICALIDCEDCRGVSKSCEECKLAWLRAEHK